MATGPVMRSPLRPGLMRWAFSAAQKPEAGRGVVEQAGDKAGNGTRKNRISREIVLDAALKLVDEEALEALTMRRLGQALHRG